VVKQRPTSGTWPASQWDDLFARALLLLDTLPKDLSWNLGGGTCLALRYHHRISYDVDVFVTDAQAIPYLSPRLNDAAAALAGESYVEDSASLKLTITQGDIDIIVAPILTSPGLAFIGLQGREIAVQTPEEILAKKIQYRGHAFTHRDAFDLAMLLAWDPPRVALALKGCGKANLERLQDRLRLLVPVLAKELPDFVYPTPRARSFLQSSPDILRRWLEGEITPSPPSTGRPAKHEHGPG